MKTLANAKTRELARAKVIPTSQHGMDKLICEGVVGIQEWNSTVNDYADSGKRRPKNPDSLGPPFPT